MAHRPARTGTQPVRAGRRRLSRDERLAYLILLPALGAVFVIVTIPFVLVIIQSLSTEDGTFVGSINYSRALANPLLYEAIRATGLYTLIVLPTEILLGLSFALLVHRTVRRFFSRFLKSYWQRRGYKEGWRGVLLALFSGLYPVLTHIKALDLRERANRHV